MEINQENLDAYNAKLSVLNKEFGFILASESFIDGEGRIKSRVVVVPKPENKDGQGEPKEGPKEDATAEPTKEEVEGVEKPKDDKKEPTK